MQNVQQPSAGNSVIDTYISAIFDAFGTEPWADIELYAERAWAQIRSQGDPQWEDVRDMVGSRWAT